MLRITKQFDTEEELRIAYRVFDKTSKGDIPLDELQNVFQYLKKDKFLGITEGEIKEILLKCDINNNGDFSYKSFLIYDFFAFI